MFCTYSFLKGEIILKWFLVSQFWCFTYHSDVATPRVCECNVHFDDILIKDSNYAILLSHSFCLWLFMTCLLSDQFRLFSWRRQCLSLWYFESEIWDYLLSKIGSHYHQWKYFIQWPCRNYSSQLWKWR